MLTYVSPFYLMSGLYVTGAVAFLLLMALAGLQVIPSLPGVTWLRIHIVTIGAVTQALFGALPALAAARLGGEGQPAGAAWKQWSLLNVGFILLLVGMPAQPRHIFLAVTGATLVFLAVLSLVNSLYGMARRSPRGAGAGAGTRFYLTAPIFFLVGITLAVSMLLGWPAPGGWAGTREAHIHANNWGFLSLAAAGILIDLTPVLTGRPLARPGWVSASYWLITIGAVLLVAGPWLDVMPVMLAGMVPFLIGVILLLVNVARSRDPRGPMPVRATHLLASYIWVFAPIVAAPALHLVPGLLPIAAAETAALQGLAYGWGLQLAIAALPVLVAGIRYGPGGTAARPVLPDAPAFGVFAINGGMAAVWAGNIVSSGAGGAAAGGAVLATGYALIAAGLLPALGQLWRLATGAPGARAGDGGRPPA